MKCLLLHCKSFSYRLDHPTPVADSDVDKQDDHFSDALVVFVAAEKKDDIEMARKAAQDILAVQATVKAATIVINPFAHLSSELAKPSLAREVLKELTQSLEVSSPIPVVYTSFGWYKEFTTDVHGHGQSQLFRSY